MNYFQKEEAMKKKQFLAVFLCLALAEGTQAEPSTATQPIPFDSATNISVCTDLCWTPAGDATYQEVYFGTEPTSLILVMTGDGTLKTVNNAALSGPLECHRTYHWRVDTNEMQGNVWSFTVADHLVVDDFEAYNDSNNLIYDAWIDGFLNWTGSEVNLGTVPYAPVHGGKQSLIYDYNNSFDWGNGYYSEVERQYDSPQNWTASGVKALTLYFYGDPNNDASYTEQMYVGSEDSSGASSYTEVRYGDYGEDMNDVKIPEWQEWNIALQDFNDGGVNLTDVRKVYIGFGDRNDPQAGGSGTIYFDDIRLYSPRCIAKYAPAADFTGDCVVDFADVGTMAEEWLTIGIKADLFKDNNVDFKDYAIMAEMWFEEHLWP